MLPFDHQLKIGSVTKGLKLIRQQGQVLYKVSDLIASSVENYQEELRYTQKDWKGGHGKHDWDQYEDDKYFEGASIDTTQDGRIFLGPLINTVLEDDDSVLDSHVTKFMWFSAIKRLLCATAGKIYRYAIGPLYEYYDEGDDGVGAAYDTYWFAQSFTPLDSHTVTNVSLKMYRVATPGTVTVNIKACTSNDPDTGEPTGAALATGTTDGDTLTVDSTGEWRNITLGAGAALTAGTMYCIEVSAAASAPVSFACWKVDATAPAYSGGSYIYSPDSGANWTVANGDFMFREYAATSANRWSAATTTLAGVTDLIEFNGIAYAAMGASIKYYYSTNGNTWTQTDLTDGYANGFLVAPTADGTSNVLWKFKTPNQVSSTTDGRTVAGGGSQWASPTYVGDTSNNITRLFLVGDKLMVGKEDGLFLYTTSGAIESLMDDLKVNRGVNNFKYVTNWKTSGYFSLVNGMGEITTGNSYDYMGPITEIDDISKVGTCVGLTSEPEFIYAAFDEGTNTVIYKGRNITRYQGVRWEWCPWVAPLTNQINTIAVVQHSATDKRLWFSYGTGVSYSTAYVILTDNPTADSNATFAATGWIRMPYTMGTDPYWVKNIQSVITETEACTANLTVTPKYRKNTDTGATNLTAAITTNGYVKTDATTEVSCNRIQFELHLATNSSATSPEVKYFQARGQEQPETIRMHECTYAVDGGEFQDTKTLRDFLRTGTTATAVIRFSDLNFTPKGTAGTAGTDYVNVKMMGRPEETPIYHERDKQPELAVRVRFREVN